MFQEFHFAVAKLDPSDAELFPAPPPAAQPAHNWRSDSLNQLQTVPAPRHKEGAVRIRYHYGEPVRSKSVYPGF